MFADDLNVIFDDFAIPVTFKLAGIVSGELEGILNPTSEMESPYQGEVVVSRLELWFKTAEVSAFDNRHTLTFGAVEHRQYGEPFTQGDFTRIRVVRA